MSDDSMTYGGGASSGGKAKVRSEHDPLLNPAHLWEPEAVGAPFVQPASC